MGDVPPYLYSGGPVVRYIPIPCAATEVPLGR